MGTQVSRARTQEIVRAVLAADCACPESVFDHDGLFVTAAEVRDGRRRYPQAARPLSLVTMGRGVVVSCHSPWIAALHTLLQDHSREEMFSAPTITALSRFVEPEGAVLRGPALSHVCAPAAFRPAVDPEGVTFEVVEGEAVFALYRYPGFDYALSYDPDHSRPDVAAAVAWRGDRVIGIAGMSADCDVMWQIGIAVVAEERGAGVGRALVGRLTEVAFQRNRVPWYAADIGNIRSHALAASLGYWPSWVELFAREHVPG
jgi:GNAT superfamily N-acetyltransferase